MASMVHSCLADLALGWMHELGVGGTLVLGI